MQTVLFVLTSSATMGKGREPTRLWLEEFTVPYFAVRDAGYRIDVLSTAGGAVPIDPRSLRNADRIAENRRYHDDHALMETLRSIRPVDQIQFADYDAIFLPGGHGTMWDLPNSDALARGVSVMFTAGKPVAAACHGPAGLVSARLPDGVPLVAARWATAFTTEEERAVGLQDKVPFLLDERLGELGARVIKGEPFAPMAVAHGNLITGQNPQSAREVAGMAIAALRRRGNEETGQPRAG